MDKLPQVAQPQFVEALLEEIFHGFHVVVGGAFDGFDVLGIGGAEMLEDGVQVVDTLFIEGFQLGQTILAKGYKVLNFNKNPVADKGVLAEVFGQFAGFVGITAVDG